MPVVYQHSGKISLFGAHVYFILGLIASVGISAFCGFAIWFLHKMEGGAFWINILIPAFGGGFLGYLLGYFGKFSKIRNPRFIFKSAVFFGLLFIYVSWVTTLYLIGGQPEIVISPNYIFNAAIELSQNGYWEIFGWQPTGTILIAIWCIEGILILLSTSLISLHRLIRDAYCEESGIWADEELVVEPFDPVVDVHFFKSRVLDGDFTPILDLKLSDGVRYQYAAVELVGFSKNPDFKLITVKNIERDFYPEKTKENVVVQNVISTRETNQLLRELWINQPAAEKRLNKVK